MKYLLFCQFLLLFFPMSICLADENTSNGSIQEDILQIIKQIDRKADSYLQNTPIDDENITSEAIDDRQNLQSTILPAIQPKSLVKQKKFAQPKRISAQQKTFTKDNNIRSENQQSSNFNQITELLNNWANSWSNGNVNAYINFYSKDFSPTNRSRNQWLENRKKLIKPERKINIKISQIKLKIITKDEMISSQFNQTFSSNHFTDVSKKQLLWKKEHRNWVISSEKTIK